MCGQTQELEEQRKATQFKASAARSLIIPPFVPKPSDKALSEISNFTLHRFASSRHLVKYLHQPYVVQPIILFFINSSSSCSEFPHTSVFFLSDRRAEERAAYELERSAKEVIDELSWLWTLSIADETSF